MTLFTTLLLCGAVILGFFLLIDGLIYIIANSGDRGDSRRKRRLKATARATALADTAIEKIPREDRAPRRISINDYIDDLIARAGVATPRDHVYVSMGLVAIATFLVLLFAGFGIPLVLRILASVVIGVVLPIMRLKGEARKRLSKFV